MATARPTRRARPRAGPERTRAKILRTAERLFARDGFDRVTVRQIAREAQQRNVAAVQYHFGSKQALLDAIVDGHRREIDARRQALLDEHAAQARPDDLASMIEILLAPLAAKLDSPSGRDYLRIQAQGLRDETMRPATRVVVQRIGASLGKRPREKPQALEHGDRNTPYRDRFALLLLFHALADRARQEEAGRKRPGRRAEFVAALARALEGLFSADDAT